MRVIRILFILVLFSAGALAGVACGDEPPQTTSEGDASAETTAEPAGGTTVEATEETTGGATSGATGETTGGTTGGTTAETTQEALSPGEGNLIIYSGRSEELVGPIIEQFEEETGVDVQTRYGDTAQLASTILEEGENTPADLFFAQDPGALGALADAGRFQELPQNVLEPVPARFRSPDDLWVGTSGRVRVVAYNTEALTRDELPDSIFGFTDPEWEGRVGWAPTNGSFQAFVTAMREIEGEDRARAWLEGIQANDPFEYPDNSTALQGVASGEVEVAFVNHYYLYRALEEEGQDFGARNYNFASNDPGNLVIVAGTGILDSATNPEAARSFIQYLLAEEAQQYFADETFEYPMIEGVQTAEGLESLSEIRSPEVNLGNLDDLQGTIELLRETGVL
ncbi:MAG: iron ABC transporter substrate-binding protein [Actinomycetota bacterium]|nr:iron ABC transporter substrate-binding protein [Actinomycetota bacterium]